VGHRPFRPTTPSYYFAGPKRGRREVFAQNLPGWPDNVRLSTAGNSFYVSLFGFRSEDTYSFFDSYGRWPALRKLIGEVGGWAH